MKIITYNVNGIRSAFSKGLAQWLQSVDADIVCLQETKAQPEQLTDEIIPLIEQLGYHHYWHSAEKKGYSGVAIFSKIKPIHVEIGCGNPDFDREGRVLRADFEHFSIISAYFPSGSSGEERQEIKYDFLDFMYTYLHALKWKFPNLIVSGDYNICHKPIDIHNPKSNVNSSGFLPEERAWMDRFIEDEMIDTFRHFNQEPHHYTWWSFRAGARSKNLGWRIDYHIATRSMKPLLRRSQILPEAKHSDHCPVLLELNNVH